MIRWLRTFDRCQVDGRRIWSHGGYTLCRKHAQQSGRLNG